MNFLCLDNPALEAKDLKHISHWKDEELGVLCPKKTHSLTDLCCQDCKKLVVMETLANLLDKEIVEIKTGS